MAERIVAAVKRQREVIEGVQQQTELHGLISRYATAQLYHRTGPQTERLRREIVHLLAKKYFPLAQKVGVESAAPILDGLGGSQLVEKGNVLRGRVLRGFKQYHQANIRTFETELAQEIGTLRGEVRSAFARARRDGATRKQLVRDLLDADKSELKRLAEVRREIQAKGKAVAKAEATGTKPQIRKARRELAKAKAKIRTTKSFYARFETRVQGRARDAVRREAQRAQYHAFKQAGFTGTYTWVAVNGSDACPSCEALHGTNGLERTWRGRMPGDGHTYCGASCQCQLVPDEYVAGRDSLSQPINPYKPI